MAQFAYLEGECTSDEDRATPRRTLRLSPASETAQNDRARIVIHELSETGLLLEGSLGLAQGEELDVVLPETGAGRVTVVWASGRFFAFQFGGTVPGEVAQTPVRSGMDAIPKKGSPEAVSLAAVQLQELSMAIERISMVLDRAMGQLSKREH